MVYSLWYRVATRKAYHSKTNQETAVVAGRGTCLGIEPSARNPNIAQ